MGWPTSEPSYVLDRRGIDGTVVKAWQALRAVIASPATARAQAEAIRRSRQRSASESARLVVRWLYLRREVAALARRTGIHVFDQGLLQALWSVAYQAADPSALDALTDPLLSLPIRRPIAVLLLSDLATVRRRLTERQSTASRVEQDLERTAGEEPLTKAQHALAAVLEIAHRLELSATWEVLRFDTGDDKTPEQIVTEVTGALCRSIGARAAPTDQAMSRHAL